MQISPAVAMWIKIVIAVLTAITTGALSLTGLVSAATATQIVALAGVGTVVLGIVMSAYSSSAPGPAAPADPPVVVAATRLANLPAGSSQVAISGAKAAAERAIDNHVV